MAFARTGSMVEMVMVMIQEDLGYVLKMIRVYVKARYQRRCMKLKL